MAQRLLGSLRDAVGWNYNPDVEDGDKSSLYDDDALSLWPHPEGKEIVSFDDLVENIPSLRSTFNLFTQYAIVGQIYLSGRLRPPVRAGALGIYLHQEYNITIPPPDLKKIRTMLGPTPWISQISRAEGLHNLFDAPTQARSETKSRDGGSRELKEYKAELNSLWFSIELEKRREWLRKWKAPTFYGQLFPLPDILDYGYAGCLKTDDFLQRLLPEINEQRPRHRYAIIAQIWLSYLKAWPIAVQAESIGEVISDIYAVSIKPERIVHTRRCLKISAYRIPHNPQADAPIFAVASAFLDDVDAWWERKLEPEKRECLMVLWKAGETYKENEIDIGACEDPEWL